MGALHENLAVQDDLKRTAREMIEEFEKLGSSKAHLIDGFVKYYEPSFEDGEELPSEEYLVATTVGQKMSFTSSYLIKNIDNKYAISETNRIAEAALEVDGIIWGVYSATTFLEMEKDLTRLLSMYSSIPTLATNQTWHQSKMESGIYETPMIETARTVKRTKNEVVVPATDKFPAQVYQQTYDETVGTWTTIRKTGRISSRDKSILIQRIERLLEAVKKARAKANQVEAVKMEMGKKIFDYINKDIL